MSKAALKKTMSALEKEQVIEIVCELYDARKEAKEYLEYWLNPNPAKALETAKESVDKMFFFTSGKNRKEPSATSLKKLVKDFSLMVFEPEMIADLLVHIAMQHYKWLTGKTSGFMTVETSVRRSYENAFTYVEGAGLEPVYGLKLQRLKEYIDDFFRHPPEPKRKHRRRWWR